MCFLHYGWDAHLRFVGGFVVLSILQFCNTGVRSRVLVASYLVWTPSEPFIYSLNVSSRLGLPHQLPHFPFSFPPFPPFNPTITNLAPIYQHINKPNTKHQTPNILPSPFLFLFLFLFISSCPQTPSPPKNHSQNINIKKVKNLQQIYPLIIQTPTKF